MPINPLVSGLTSVAYLVCLLLITGVQAFYPALTSNPVYSGTGIRIVRNDYYASGYPVSYTGIPGSYSLVSTGCLDAVNSVRVFTTAGGMVANIDTGQQNSLPTQLTDSMALIVGRDWGGTHRWSYQLTQSGSVFTFSTISSSSNTGMYVFWFQYQTSTNYVFGANNGITFKADINNIGSSIGYYDETITTRNGNNLKSWDSLDVLIKTLDVECVIFIARSSMSLIVSYPFSATAKCGEIDNINNSRYYYMLMTDSILFKYDIHAWSTATDALGTADLSAYGTANTIMNFGHFQYILVFLFERGWIRPEIGRAHV